MVPLCTVCCKGLSRSNHNGLNGPTLRIAGKMHIMQTIKIMCLAVGSTGAKCFQSARTQFHLGIVYHPFPFPFPLPPASRVRRFTAAINCAAWSGVLRLGNTAQGCIWGCFVGSLSWLLLWPVVMSYCWVGALPFGLYKLQIWRPLSSALLGFCHVG